MSVCRGHIISRDQFATEVKEFYFRGLLESFESPGNSHGYWETGRDRLQARGYRSQRESLPSVLEVLEDCHAGGLDFELN